MLCFQWKQFTRHCSKVLTLSVRGLHLKIGTSNARKYTTASQDTLTGTARCAVSGNSNGRYTARHAENFDMKIYWKYFEGPEDTSEYFLFKCPDGVLRRVWKQRPKSKIKEETEMHSKEASEAISRLHAAAQDFENGNVTREEVNAAMLAVEQFYPGYADARVSWPSQLTKEARFVPGTLTDAQADALGQQRESEKSVEFYNRLSVAAHLLLEAIAHERDDEAFRDETNLRAEEKMIRIADGRLIAAVECSGNIPQTPDVTLDGFRFLVNGNLERISTGEIYVKGVRENVAAALVGLNKAARKARKSRAQGERLPQSPQPRGRQPRNVFSRPHGPRTHPRRSRNSRNVYGNSQNKGVLNSGSIKTPGTFKAAL